jgi:hypothetical protein
MRVEDPFQYELDDREYAFINLDDDLNDNKNLDGIYQQIIMAFKGQHLLDELKMKLGESQIDTPIKNPVTAESFVLCNLHMMTSKLAISMVRP